MEIKNIDLKIRELQLLEKENNSLYTQAGEFRVIKDAEKEKEVRRKIKETESEISKLNIEIGKMYEEQALSLNLEEELLVLLRAFEYYKLSSYKESIRILTDVKQLAIKTNNSEIKNLCEAQKIYIECKELDDEAENLWYKITESVIEDDSKCIQLSIKRDKIIKKLKEGLQYAQETVSPELVIDFYYSLTWNLFRRCDRNKFLTEVRKYHREIALILECMAWKSYPANKETSQKYLMRALDQYLQSSSNEDRDRIITILVNAFEMSDFDYFILIINNTETIEDIEELEIIINERIFDEKDSVLYYLKLRKAVLYSRLATENIDDISSFFIAAQYFEECHKDNYLDSEMGPDMGESLFQKSRGNLRLAINDGLLTSGGKEHLKTAIEQIKKSIYVSDWAFIEPTYLSIYESIDDFVLTPITDLNRKRIEEVLNEAHFMTGQENSRKEKIISNYMDKLFESISSNDKVSALNCIKAIDKTIVSENEYEVDLERFSKMQLNKESLIEKWAKCKTESDKHKKGKLLEQFTLSLFSTIEGFIPLGSNLNTANEEFDVIFRNNVDRPFLQALGSPLIIFECKNWSKKIDIGEVKAFSADLFDHNNLVKIGIFIAVNGFEAGCVVQQIRLSRSDKILILVTGEDVEKFLNSTKDTLVWLEDLISSGFK